VLLARVPWTVALAIVSAAIFSCFLGSWFSASTRLRGCCRFPGSSLSIVYPTLNSEGHQLLSEVPARGGRRRDLVFHGRGCGARAARMGAISDAYGTTEAGFRAGDGVRVLDAPRARGQLVARSVRTPVGGFGPPTTMPRPAGERRDAARDTRVRARSAESEEPRTADRLREPPSEARSQVCASCSPDARGALRRRARLCRFSSASTAQTRDSTRWITCAWTRAWALGTTSLRSARETDLMGRRDREPRIGAAPAQFLEFMERGARADSPGCSDARRRVSEGRHRARFACDLSAAAAACRHDADARGWHAAGYFWTTFTSEQIDIDVTHPRGIEYLDDILRTFGRYGIKMIRLDAIGYAIKKAGGSCFHAAETFEFIAR